MIPREKHKIIISATDRLFSKMQLLDLKNLNISESGRKSFSKYIDHYSYYMCYYSQLFHKAFRNLNKPITESILIDYGGGCGILSLLAKEIGFKTVVYNDFNHKSFIDAQIISRSLGITIDYYIYGDVEEFIREINFHKIKPDLICSFDVLEHIYDLEFWIRALLNIENKFSLFFMTGAN